VKIADEKATKAAAAPNLYEKCRASGHTPAECWTLGMPEHIVNDIDGIFDDKIDKKVKEVVKSKEASELKEEKKPRKV
jgi:hypothetical protein